MLQDLNITVYHILEDIDMVKNAGPNVVHKLFGAQLGLQKGHQNIIQEIADKILIDGKYISIKDILDEDEALKRCVVLGFTRDGNHLVAYEVHSETSSESEFNLLLWSFQPQQPCQLQWKVPLHHPDMPQGDAFTFKVAVYESSDSTLFAVKIICVSSDIGDNPNQQPFSSYVGGTTWDFILPGPVTPPGSVVEVRWRQYQANILESLVIEPFESWSDDDEEKEKDGVKDMVRVRPPNLSSIMHIPCCTETVLEIIQAQCIRCPRSHSIQRVGAGAGVGASHTITDVDAYYAHGTWESKLITMSDEQQQNQQEVYRIRIQPSAESLDLEKCIFWFLHRYQMSRQNLTDFHWTVVGNPTLPLQLINTKLTIKININDTKSSRNEKNGPAKRYVENMMTGSRLFWTRGTVPGGVCGLVILIFVGCCTPTPQNNNDYVMVVHVPIVTNTNPAKEQGRRDEKKVRLLNILSLPSKQHRDGAHADHPSSTRGIAMNEFNSTLPSSLLQIMGLALELERKYCVPMDCYSRDGPTVSRITNWAMHETRTSARMLQHWFLPHIIVGFHENMEKIRENARKAWNTERSGLGMSDDDDEEEERHYI